MSEKQLYQKRDKSFLCVMQQKHGDNDKALLMANKFSTESLKTIFLQVDRVTACQTLSGSGKLFFFVVVK